MWLAECSVQWVVIMSTLDDIMNRVEDDQYGGGYYETCGRI